MSDNGNGLIGINSHFVAEDNDGITRKHTHRHTPVASRQAERAAQRQHTAA